MTGLSDPTVVDLITQAADGEIALIISHDQPWTDADPELALLLEKVNSYAAFVLDDGLLSSYPASADQPKRIQVDCATRPTPRVADLLDRAEQALKPYGVRLVVNLLP